jgi:hypothetical protein
MFGIEKRVKRVRDALIQAFQAKQIEIMAKYENLKPDQIPKHDLTRAMVMYDLAQILITLSVDKHPDDEKDG